MKRFPIFSTLIVGAAVATMIALGLWQLDRRAEKAALLALYRANLTQPAMAFPKTAPVADAALFRRSALMCLEVTGWKTEAGRSIQGASGYRWIAACRTGAEGPGALVDMGVARNPSVRPTWSGGPISGRISTEPSHMSLFDRLGGKQEVLRPMLIATMPAAGLAASAPPSPEDVPNNHLAYAVQWFLFASIAAIIYLIALRRRMRAG